MDEEFREFVAARSAALLRVAYLLAGDWATAEDLLQTALTKTYLAWKRLGEIEAVEPYARRVLINTATSWWRRRWHGERPTEILPERPAPDEIETQVERDRLWRHLQSLPVRQRAVLVLRFYEDLSEAQTAALLNISPGTVKSQTFRALNTLRRRLGAEAEQVLGSATSAAPPTPRPATGRAASSSTARGPAPSVAAPRTPVAEPSAAPATGGAPAQPGTRPAVNEPASRPHHGGTRQPAGALAVPVLGAEA
jgi:RNA polymerase sigma-70 factor (sigma-E family)